MSFKIFNSRNTKNSTIINKNHKEKTNLLESTNLTPKIFNKTNNNCKTTNSKKVTLKLTKNNRPKKYKKKK